MQEYIEGEFFETGRPEHFLEAARVLAQYHLAVDGFSDDLALTSRPAYDPQFILNSLQKLEQLWNLAGSRCASHQLAQLQGQCADLDVRFAAHGALPRLLIHGDYYADNLLFAAHRIVGVVDYDKFRLDARVVEVAEALIYFASPQVHHLQHLVYPGVLQWASLKQFLEAYCQVSSL